MQHFTVAPHIPRGSADSEDRLLAGPRHVATFTDAATDADKAIVAASRQVLSALKTAHSWLLSAQQAEPDDYCNPSFDRAMTKIEMAIAAARRLS
jgi:hypothetical protein